MAKKCWQGQWWSAFLERFRTLLQYFVSCYKLRSSLLFKTIEEGAFSDVVFQFIFDIIIQQIMYIYTLLNYI